LTGRSTIPELTVKWRGFGVLGSCFWRVMTGVSISPARLRRYH
jgi:hypothetical protein